MALTQCRECGRTVSTDAPACPHCGCSSPAATPDATGSQPRESETAEEMAATAETPPEDEETIEAPRLARSIPGSVEAAVLLIGAALLLLAVGARSQLPLVLCAGGLVCGKPWWRELTFWLLALSVPVGLLLFGRDLADVLRSSHLASGLLLSLGSLAFTVGLAALVFPSGRLEQRGARAWTACGAAGLVLVLVGRLHW